MAYLVLIEHSLPIAIQFQMSHVNELTIHF